MKDVYGVVAGTEKKPSKAPEEWDEKDLSQTLIVSTVDSSQLDLIMNCKSASEMWKKLEDYHYDKSEFSKQLLYTRYFSYIASLGQSAVSTFLEIEKVIASLRDLGEIISDTRAVARVVSALPNELKPFKASWDSTPAKQQTMDCLFQRLKKVDAEMKPVGAPKAESSGKDYMVEQEESSDSEYDIC